MTQDKVDRLAEEIIKSIEDKQNRQKEIILAYATLLTHRQITAGRDFRWKEINEGIIERWSESGLKTIKEAAWKEFEKRQIIVGKILLGLYEIGEKV